jgi:hypothetical protein
MAQLPPDGEWLIQQMDGIVSLFNRYTQQELVKFNPANADETARTQQAIYALPELTAEQKCFAHFWSGYFYANAGGVVR